MIQKMISALRGRQGNQGPTTNKQKPSTGERCYLKFGPIVIELSNPGKASIIIAMSFLIDILVIVILYVYKRN